MFMAEKELTYIWNGFHYDKVQFEDHDALIVYPKQANGWLALKTEYWNAFPEAMEIPLLEQGFHLCFIKNDTRWGMDPDLDRQARFVRFVQQKLGLKEKCVPVGMSCGGLIAIKLAAKYPELIQCLYLDAPLLNYFSYPCGYGVVSPGPRDLLEMLNALGLRKISELLCYREMPMHRLDALVASRIPAVMVVGDSDSVVPYCENGTLLEQAYKAAGIDLEVYTKIGGDHHPHGLEDPTPALQFILKHCQ